MEQDREKAYDSVKMYVANDWEILEETPDYFMLRRNEQSVGVHILVFLITFWFTFGIGNILYWYISIKKKKILK